MIKTLKSELKLRPTYDELVGMIESQGDPNRPSIEQIIDRRATFFRNNQFGSQFDNIDFLGLKKQEEDRARENLRQAQLKDAQIQAGTNTMPLVASGFMTPAEVYDAMDDDEMTSEEATRIRAEMERYLQRQQQAQQASSSTARSDLDGANRQSIPVGVMDEEDDMPPLEEIEEGEEEDEFEDDPELIPADDDEATKAPAQPRKHKETIDYSIKISKWQDKKRSRRRYKISIIFTRYRTNT